MNLNKRRAIIGSLFSVVPGCGHLYFRHWAKALSLFVIDAALLAGVFISNMPIIQVLMLIVYGVIVFSSISDMRVLSGLQPQNKFNDSQGYIAFLLLTTGVNALPLLWQSKAYGRLGKVVWTITVPALAIVFFGGLFLLVRG